MAAVAVSFSIEQHLKCVALFYVRTIRSQSQATLKHFYLFTTVLLSVFLAKANAYKAPPVIGYVDGFRDGKIFGWACQKFVPASLDVHLYVRNAAGRPGAIIVKGAKANRYSDSVVANVCGTEFHAYRYEIQLTPQERRRYRNYRVFVHGIKFFGDVPNSLLINSGRYRIDPVTGPAPGDPCKTGRDQYGICD